MRRSLNARRKGLTCVEKHISTIGPAHIVIFVFTEALIPPPPLRKYRRHMLTPQQVQARLTLFPKYFASFPHGTSVLLISRVYCTLNEVYHQIGAYVSESATHIAYAVRIPRKDRTELSPSIHPNTKGDGSEGMLTNCYTKL